MSKMTNATSNGRGATTAGLEFFKSVTGTAAKKAAPAVKTAGARPSIWPQSAEEALIATGVLFGFIVPFGLLLAQAVMRAISETFGAFAAALGPIPMIVGLIVVVGIASGLIEKRLSRVSPVR